MRYSVRCVTPRLDDRDALVGRDYHVLFSTDDLENAQQAVRRLQNVVFPDDYDTSYDIYDAVTQNSILVTAETDRG